MKELHKLIKEWNAAWIECVLCGYMVTKKKQYSSLLCKDCYIAKTTRRFR